MNNAESDSFAYFAFVGFMLNTVSIFFFCETGHFYLAGVTVFWAPFWLGIMLDRAMGQRAEKAQKLMPTSELGAQYRLVRHGLLSWGWKLDEGDGEPHNSRVRCWTPGRALRYALRHDELLRELGLDIE